MELEPLVVLKAMSKEKSWLEIAVEEPDMVLERIKREVPQAGFESLPFLEIHKLSPPYAFVEFLKEPRTFSKGEKDYEFVDVEKLEPQKQKDGSYKLVGVGKYTLSLGITALAAAIHSFGAVTGKKACIAWLGKKKIQTKFGKKDKHDFRVKVIEE